MGRRELGLLLRLLGPLIQLTALALLLGGFGDSRWRPFLLGLFLIGFGLVLCGVILSRPRRSNRPETNPNDSGRLTLHR